MKLNDKLGRGTGTLKPALCPLPALGLTALGHDGGVLPQHGGGRFGQGDDDLQGQLPLHVGQVGVATQLGSKGGRDVSNPGASGKGPNTSIMGAKACMPLAVSCRASKL